MVIFHLIEPWQNINLSKIYREIFKDIQIKYNIKLYICYKSHYWKIIKNKIQTSISYNKDDQFIWYIQDNYKIEDVIITTFSESLVGFCHYLKKILWQTYTQYYDIFLDKNKQRLSTKEYPEIGVQSYTIWLEHNLKIEDINYLSYPLIIKPVAGVGSRWVQKITNFEELKNAILIIKDTLIILWEKNLHNKKIIIEEYIDGEQYVFNYFVNNNSNYTLSLPTKVFTLQDININDFGNWIRLITPDIYDNIDNIKLHNNISKTIIWWKIANTYVSHNIKITPNGEYKTVEINWRIGWYRLEMNWLAAKYNLFNAIIDNNTIEHINIKKSLAVISIRPIWSSKLKSFNKDIINKIKWLQSFWRLTLHTKLIGEVVWLSHQWYSPLGTIVLLNENHNIFNQDLNTIKELYIHIINISKN
jgi:hypothetical protein